MKKIRLGQTGMMVTQLGFGGIPIQRDTEDEAVAVVKKCLELGINYCDTANAYSTSEERIGKAIAGRRKDVIIATKTGLRTGDGVRDHLALSLKHLGTDYIDLYQFHAVNDFKTLDHIFADDGAMKAAHEAKKEGKIRHIGITSHSLEVAKEAARIDRFETVMFPFNFVTDEAATELLPICRQHDVGLIAMKPIAGGMIENVNIAIKYLFQFPDICVIPGIQLIPEIEQIAGIVNGNLEITAAEKAEMQRLKAELGRDFCHRCDYCQPCPAGIPISTIMTANSFFKRLPPESFFNGPVAKAIAKSYDCIDCGACESQCPYQLEIRDITQERVNWFNEEKRKWEASNAK